MAANDVLNGIIHHVKDSKLNFTMNLTPFSAYITIRSSFVKNFEHPNSSLEQLEPKPQSYESVQVNELENENRTLSLKVKSLEKENMAINAELENLSKSNNVNDLENLKAKSEASTIKEEKRLLQIKHEKICAEMKIVKNDREDLAKKFNSLSVADKTKKKEIFELKKRFDIYNEELEIKVRDLEAFREQKIDEERAQKHQEKKIKKKAKRDLQKEAKVKAAEMKSFRTSTKFIDTNENVTPKVVIEEETGACELKEETKNVDEDSEDVDSVLEPNYNKDESSPTNLSKHELEQSEQNNSENLEKIIEFDRLECDEEIAAIRAITIAVCDDLMNKLIVSDDT